MQTPLRICLVQANTDTSKYYFDFTIYKLFEHMGLEYLQASLEKAGFESKILVGPAMEISDASIIEQVLKIRPRLVGFTLDSHSLSASMLMAEKIKQSLPETHITVGGHLATCVAEEILSDFEFIDSAVVGYGEETIVQIAHAISKSQSLNAISGIVFRNEDELVRNSPNLHSMDIDDISFPSRSVLRWRKKHGYPSAARMITSRGCPFSCNMCTTPAFLRSQKCPKWIARSPRNVMDEIADFVKDHGIRVIVFCDDNFIGHGRDGTQRAKEFAQLLIESDLNLHFWIMCKIDSFDNCDVDLVKLLKKAGLWGIFLGVESGSTPQLRAFGKPTDIKKAKSLINLLHKQDILIELGFIMFYPYATFEELRENASFLNQVQESSIFRYFANCLLLYPGIRFISDLRQRNLLIKDYRYDKILGYNYEDQRVGMLAAGVCKIADDLNCLDEAIWNMKRLDSLISLLTEDCVKNSNIHELASKFHTIKKGLASGLRNVSEINYHEFLKYLEIASESKDVGIDEFPSSEHKDLLRREVSGMTAHIQKLRNVVKDKTEALKDGDLLECFLNSPVNEMLHNYE